MKADELRNKGGTWFDSFCTCPGQCHEMCVSFAGTSQSLTDTHYRTLRIPKTSREIIARALLRSTIEMIKGTIA
jgi:hypothetical protein